MVFLSQQKYQVPDADPPIFTCPYQTQVFKTKITRILPKYGNRYFRAHIGTTYKVAQKPGRQGWPHRETVDSQKKSLKKIFFDSEFWTQITFSMISNEPI